MGGDTARRSPRQSRAHGESWGFIDVDVIVNIKPDVIGLNFIKGINDGRERLRLAPRRIDQAVESISTFGHFDLGDVR